MTQRRVRPVAIAIFQRGDQILVEEGRDSVKGETFYRPLGGEIEFGEKAREALVRELAEEVGAEVEAIRPLGALENIFTFEGADAHEIVLVYLARFSDPARFEEDPILGAEHDGTPVVAWWLPLDYFREGRALLYPEGLLELLDGV